MFGSTAPENYYDLQTIVANPPAPGTLSPPGYEEGVTYVSNPKSLGPISFHGCVSLYVNSLKSKAITVNVDGSQPAPISVEVVFDCSGKNEIEGSISVDFLSFSLVLKLTLSKDVTYEKIDALSWVTDLNNLVFTEVPFSNPPLYNASGSFLGQPVSGDVTDPVPSRTNCWPVSSM